MRIIAGLHKGKKIYSVAGHTARPTTDFVREMLFSTLFSLAPNMDNVLDLYAGSGAFGFEALSRGASYVTFVDMSRNSVKTILANMDILQCHDKCRMVAKRVEVFLKIGNWKCEMGNAAFDLIFVDPPYAKLLINPTIALILENDCLADDGIVIAEHSIDEPINANLKRYVFKEKKSGHTVISFINFRGQYADI